MLFILFLIFKGGTLANKWRIVSESLNLSPCLFLIRPEAPSRSLETTALLCLCFKWSCQIFARGIYAINRPTSGPFSLLFKGRESCGAPRYQHPSITDWPCTVADVRLRLTPGQDVSCLQTAFISVHYSNLSGATRTETDPRRRVADISYR